MTGTPGIPVSKPPFYLSYSAEVNPTTTEGLLDACAKIVAQGHTEIYLMLSTPGGSVMNGMNVYNVLRGLPVKLTTHNVGNVDSIGNVIFLAGEERVASPNATFMFHGVGFDITSQMRMEEKNARELLQGIQADHARMAAIIEQRATFADQAEIRQLFLEAQTKDAGYALGKGLIHRIADVQIPPGAPIHQCVFQR